jgi:putative hydrolase of the HAD superfamily
MGNHLKSKTHLFFDLDDTLWDFEKNSSSVLNDLFVELELQNKLQVDFLVFCNAYKKITQTLWDKYAKKQVDKHYVRSRRFELLFEQFNYSNKQDANYMAKYYLLKTPRGNVLKEDCIEVLNYLKPRYQLHIITNGFKDSQNIKLHNTGLMPYFSHVIISEEHQLAKPDVAIYKLAEALAGTKSTDCVMIGDNFENDVQGSLNAGWEAIYVSDENKKTFSGNQIHSLHDLKKIF